MSKIYLKEKVMYLDNHASEILVNCCIKSSEWEFAPPRYFYHFYKENKFKINWIYINDSYSFLVTDGGIFEFAKITNFKYESTRERFFREIIGSSISSIDFVRDVLFFEDDRWFYCLEERPKFFFWPEERLRLLPKSKMVDPSLCDKPPVITFAKRGGKQETFDYSATGKIDPEILDDLKKKDCICWIEEVDEEMTEKGTHVYGLDFAFQNIYDNPVIRAKIKKQREEQEEKRREDLKTIKKNDNNSSFENLLEKYYANSDPDFYLKMRGRVLSSLLQKWKDRRPEDGFSYKELLIIAALTKTEE